MAELVEAPPPGSPPHADVQISSAILELKVMKLKRALASCIERQNQLQEDNTKLRALLETTGNVTDNNKTMLNFYEGKVTAFLSFLKEEDPSLFALADECLNKKLTSDELSTKSALNHAMALSREKVKKEEETKMEKEHSIAAVTAMTVNNVTGAVAGDANNNNGATNSPRQVNLRRDAVRPARLKSESDDADSSAQNSPGGVKSPRTEAVDRLVNLRTQEYRDELSKQAETVAKWKAEAEKHRLSEENAKRNLAAIVVYQLKKSSTSARNASSVTNSSAGSAKAAWQDAPDGLSPGPAILQEAVKARVDELAIGSGLSGSAVVSLPAMPSQQSKLAMRSRYGIFAEQPTSVHNGGRTASPVRGVNRAPPIKELDPLSSTARALTGSSSSGGQGYGFRLAVSAFLNDLGQLMRRGDAVCRRLEAIHDRLVDFRVHQKASRGVVLGEALSVDEAASMADLVNADLDAEVPDTLLTNTFIQSLLDSDGGWGEEVQLLVLGRQTLLDFMQRRVEHWKQRVGSQIDVKHDPRKFKELMQATAAANAPSPSAQEANDTAKSARVALPPSKAQTPRARKRNM